MDEMPRPKRWMNRGRWPFLMLVFVPGSALLALVASGAMSGQKQESGRARIVLIGQEQMVFDSSRDACEPADIPDQAARAFRDFSGRVRLFASHTATRGWVGESLNSVQYSCAVAFRSNFDPRPWQFDGAEWIGAPYTTDGRNVNALVHVEYHGDGSPASCASLSVTECQYNAITLASSSDGGATFTQRPPPQHLVASAPYRYVPDAGPYGLFQPSNIVRKGGHYYAMLQVERYGQQRRGTCLMRTANLADPGSWRAWDGKGFGVRFVNPYQRRLDPAKHVCQPVSLPQIGVMSSSLTFNTYLDKFVLVGPSGRRPRRGGVIWGIYFSVSEDLVHWNRERLIARTELPWTYKCGDRGPVTYPSLLDPNSRSRNFETTGRRPYMYFVRFNPHDCQLQLDRDLVRRRVEFKK